MATKKTDPKVNTSSSSSQKPNSVPASSVPVIRAKEVEAERLLQTDDQDVKFSDGIRETGEEDLGNESIEIESNLSSIDGKAALLAFYEEPMTIMIMESQDTKNPEPHVFLSVNGRGAGPMGVPWVPRGQPVTIKRKFVERLCRARIAKYGNKEVVAADGGREYVYPRTTSLKYPFTVIQDSNPKGAGWLQALLSERS